MTFPLLKLPFLAIQNVIQSLETPDKFDFSTCSQKCRRLVKCTRHPYTGIDIIVGRGRSYSSVILRAGDRTCYDWYCRGQEYSRMRVRKDRRTVGDMTIVFRKKPDKMETGGLMVEKLKVLYKYISDLFNVPILTYKYGNTPNVKLLPMALGIKKCEQMIITAVNDYTNNIPHLRYIIEEVEVSKKLYIGYYPIYSNFQMESTRFSMDILHLNTAAYITRDVFLNMDCSVIEMRRASLSSDDILEFINQWFNSENTRFERLHIESDNLKTPLDLNGFNPKPWNSSVRGQYYDERKQMNFSSGLDIIRSDGLLATVKQSEAEAIEFVVWKNRFPVYLY
ncbi:hypothetical protein GCK72_016781 [Caenorhabditis remanei]|uniref:F-box domain-containing protein n=1 Tax=Caenorhabditis remanei TaxID=31234 RepID=A0A6A5G6N8_CAERE|nr:hypothetical protein GCK72_016781 [Caenorhabditis remanei]KAF1750234.1 hypothetical protein GCK72_016781 [Caenorhabditis remanei]